MSLEENKQTESCRVGIEPFTIVCSIITATSAAITIKNEIKKWFEDTNPQPQPPAPIVQNIQVVNYLHSVSGEYYTASKEGKYEVKINFANDVNEKKAIKVTDTCLKSIKYVDRNTKPVAYHSRK